MKRPSHTVQSPPPPSCPSDSRAAYITSSSLSGRRDSGYVAPLLTLGGDLAAESVVVGLYLRVSTGHQVEGESLEEQESELRKYCAYRGFKIHQVYIKRGKSGGNTNRPEYQALVRDIESKKLSAIIVKKLDRLSRSLLDFESLMVLLQRRNVDFISLREQFDTTNAMGKAMLRIALVFAQLEREQTSERISDVMIHRASKGLYNGGVTPFGYVCVNKEWQPDKKEKPILDFIFKTFIQTRSTVATTAILNRDGITNRRGQMWDCRRILDILKNPVYIGSRRSHYGKTVKTCTIKAIGFIEIEKRITDAFQQLATPDHLKAIENKVIKHNHSIDAIASLLTSYIDHHTQQLTKLKDRQD
jgi:DNA invertase Pin-like site-specific DNA recombinase